MQGGGKGGKNRAARRLLSEAQMTATTRAAKPGAADGTVRAKSR